MRTKPDTEPVADADVSLFYDTWTKDQIDLALADRLYGIKDARVDKTCGEIRGWRGDPEKGTVANVRGFRPTESIGAAFEVIEAMRKRPAGWWCRITSPFAPDLTGWNAGFCPAGTTGWNGRMDHRAKAATPMLAVAIAALRALDGEREAL